MPNILSSQSVDELRQVRISKMNQLEAASRPAYPYDFFPLHSSTDVNYLGSNLPAGAEDRDTIVRVSGRVMARRVFGRLAFYSLQDSEGSLQLYLDRSALEDYPLLNELSDLGDLIGVEGHLRRTEKGELSVAATRWVLLAKALQPLPNKFHGLTQTG